MSHYDQGGEAISTLLEDLVTESQQDENKHSPKNKQKQNKNSHKSKE